MFNVTRFVILILSGTLCRVREGKRTAEPSGKLNDSDVSKEVCTLRALCGLSFPPANFTTAVPNLSPWSTCFFAPCFFESFSYTLINALVGGVLGLLHSCCKFRADIGVPQTSSHARCCEMRCATSSMAFLTRCGVLNAGVSVVAVLDKA